MNFFHSKWLKSFQIRTWSCSECSKKELEQLWVFIWHDLSHLIRGKKNQNSSSGKKLGSSVWRNDKHMSPFWEKATFRNSNRLKYKTNQQHIIHNLEYVMTYTLAAFVLACFNGIHHVAINFNGEQILRKWPAAYFGFLV